MSNPKNQALIEKFFSNQESNQDVGSYLLVKMDYNDYIKLKQEQEKKQMTGKIEIMKTKLKNEVHLNFKNSLNDEILFRHKLVQGNLNKPLPNQTSQQKNDSKNLTPFISIFKKNQQQEEFQIRPKEVNLQVNLPFSSKVTSNQIKPVINRFIENENGIDPSENIKKPQTGLKRPIEDLLSSDSEDADCLKEVILPEKKVKTNNEQPVKKQQQNNESYSRPETQNERNRCQRMFEQVMFLNSEQGLSKQDIYSMCAIHQGYIDQLLKELCKKVTGKGQTLYILNDEKRREIKAKM